MQRKNNKLYFFVGVSILLCSIVAATFVGAVSISFSDWLAGQLSPNEQALGTTILFELRLPRILTAAAVGAILAICGAATQGLFRNPLADPSLIGVTAGASVGAATAIFLLHTATPIVDALALSGLVSIAAFIGSVVTVLLVYKLATTDRGTSVATMLLAGIALTALAGGITSMLEFFADNNALRRISMWRMGGFDNSSPLQAGITIVCCLIICTLIGRKSKSLNALTLGESQARYLGVAVQHTKLYLIVLVAAGIAVSVVVSGVIAFVGLVVPHIVRLLVGANHHRVMPLAAIAGAILMVNADTVARTVMAPSELPVGILTALMGAPFFVSLLMQRRS